MKELAIITVMPQDLYWVAECEVQLFNFRKFGYSKYAQVIIHQRGELRTKEYWDRLQEEYPEVNFFIYKDDSITNMISVYAPIVRPHLLKKHWDNYPELKEKVILYMDSDVLFTKHLDLSQFLEDDICYLSKTPYISSEYLLSKDKDVLSYRLDDYKNKVDVIQQLGDLVGINKQTIIDNQENTGGCQYILKNIDSKFWEDVEKNTFEIRLCLLGINAQYFENENKGFQSWCADMHSLLYNLWKRGMTTVCPPELDFIWSTGLTEDYDKYYLLHNAGVFAKEMELGGEKVNMFHKADVRFRTNSMTFFDLDYSIANVSKKYCSSKYLDNILEIPNPVSVTKCFYY